MYNSSLYICKQLLLPCMYCIQYTKRKLEQRREKSNLEELTSATNDSVVSSFLIPWPDFDVSLLCCEPKWQKKEAITSKQTGLLEETVLLTERPIMETWFTAKNTKKKLNQSDNYNHKHSTQPIYLYCSEAVSYTGKFKLLNCFMSESNPHRKWEFPTQFL